MTNEDKMAIAPTDRSMPAVRMTSVWPMARAAITATCCRMMPMVLGVAKRGLRMVKMMKDSSRTSSGLIEGCECSRCWIRWTGDCCRAANCSAALAGAGGSTVVVT